MMQALNHWWLALAVTIGFIWLSYTALNYKHEEASYKKSVFSVLKPYRTHDLTVLNGMYDYSAEELKKDLPSSWK